MIVPSYTAVLKKKFSRDFVSKNRYIWINICTKTLHWSKCSALDGDPVDLTRRRSKYIFLGKHSNSGMTDMDCTSVHRNILRDRDPSVADAMSMAECKGVLAAGKLEDCSISAFLTNGEWFKFQVSFVQ